MVLFELGSIVITPGAQEAFDDAPDPIVPYIRRHVAGDWGELGAEDTEQQNSSLKPESDPERLMSVYTLSTGVKVWIVTEWDRSVTTILLPEEY